MGVSKTILGNMQRGSWIRKMFEEGIRLKEEYGPQNVFDFSLGNPDLPPPQEFKDILREEAAREGPLIHCYMPNAGHAGARDNVARYYRDNYDVPVEGRDIIMTSGAGGALNVVLKALLDEEDEVVVLAPYFVEYGFYVSNHAQGSARMVVVQTDDRFLPDPERLAQALTPKTKVVIINSPNNPTGVVYPPETLDALASVLEDASAKFGHPIYLISDEPYREILFDGLTYPGPMMHYSNTIIGTSHSKDLSLAGERIGHIAISPRAEDRDNLAAACSFCNRTLGFVNANSLMQRVVARLRNASVDISIYQRRRDLLCNALKDMGFEFEWPQGAFYVFPKTPMADDNEFCSFMRQYRVIVVPGAGFHRPGYFRISYAVPDQTIENSLEFFSKAARELGL